MYGKTKGGKKHQKNPELHRNPCTFQFQFSLFLSFTRTFVALDQFFRNEIKLFFCHHLLTSSEGNVQLLDKCYKVNKTCNETNFQFYAMNLEICLLNLFSKFKISNFENYLHYYLSSSFSLERQQIIIRNMQLSIEQKMYLQNQ